jgi:hypothetical protein
MTKFDDFKDWYLNDGLTEDLAQFTKSDVIDGIWSLREIKNNLVLTKRYELATIIRQTERDIESYLGIERLANGTYNYTSGFLLPEAQYEHAGMIFNEEKDVFDYIIKSEKREDGLDNLLDNSVDGSIS